MASRYNITQPNGVKFTLIYHQEQSKADQIERLILDPWTGYCLKNWLSDNHAQMLAPEHKVKRLLDRCGTLFLRDVPQAERDTLTSYKEMVIGSREFSLSICPEAIAEMAESGTVNLSKLEPDDRLRYQLLKDHVDSCCVKNKKAPPKKYETRHDRQMALRKQHPGCQLKLCTVLVDGSFECCGRSFAVDSTQGKYAPHKTRYGDQYDMDRIIGICCPDGKICFADQDGYPLDDALVTETTR